MHTDHGILITFEGIECSGKSTVARAVVEKLRAHDLPIILTHEPGDTALGKRIRTILQDLPVPLCPKAEYLLYAADRAQHLHELVLPALQKNEIVISDRMADSSIVYQGYGKKLDLSMLTLVNAWAMNDRQPDIVVYIRITPEVSLQRLRHNRPEINAFEQTQLAHLDTLANAYDTIMAEKNNALIINGQEPLAAVIEKTTTALLERIKTWTSRYDSLEVRESLAVSAIAQKAKAGR